MKFERSYSRKSTEMRPVLIEPNFYDYADGSCLISFGRTKVLCAATLENSVPPFMKGSGKAWMTAEYSMLPKSSSDRIRRERTSVGGRTQEIQRLIGRALRSVFSLEGWGERSLMIDCDVIQADGGTRTASITGAFICAVMAFKKLALKYPDLKSKPFPVKDYMSAISVGIVSGQCVLDLDYSEDSTAHTDMNLIATAGAKLVEVQGTAEKEPMDQEQFYELMKLGIAGTKELCELQKKIVGSLNWEV
ncbi:ribonuclease PH [bacterium]|nr:ribonuclease PH [bacterium]